MPHRDDEATISLRTPLRLDGATNAPLSLHDQAQAIRAQVALEHEEARRQGRDFDADLELAERLLGWAEEQLAGMPDDEALRAVAASARAAIEACTELDEAKRGGPSVSLDASPDEPSTSGGDATSLLGGIDATA